MTDTSLIDDRAEELILAMVERGVFRIDEEGRIWRDAVLCRGKLKPCEPRRAEYPSSNGYWRIRIMINGIRIRVSAHRVVWRAQTIPFREIPDGHVIDHKDEVKKNNRPDNLEPVTQSVNTLRALKSA